ncbi:class I SAM-dependent methyltransferase [Psychrobacter sp. FDAARGOS_221]|uniref:class I SAM-dependent methyltransferase n=1 Tax=Psychrobacter sp. FDAARGOS_221 TaxID=1975705 RepID=UPI000BB58198|nr:class I SAM-dependent methyltransferase [Psychrobacter sp. FDAARGOS_221]PNK60704.1 methyltransferase domain-containing protein [Psychrobacter sp. FDAARGOS_221]
MTQSNSKTMTHNQVVDNQFGSQATAYLNSSVHAQGQEFALVEEIVAQYDHAKVLDLGSGAGHISFYAAPHAESVIAYDLSQDMLKVVADSAEQKGLNNISTQQGVAEFLPFKDNHFDVVVSRFSAHHWQDVPQALREMRRVCQPNGTVMMIDVMAPPNPVCDTFLQTIEILRDNSHVRDYSVAEWQNMFSQAGLKVNRMQTHKLLLEFNSWVTRMRTPEHYVKAIRALQQSIGQEATDYFQVQADGSFTTDVITLIADK